MPREAANIVAKCLKKDPHARYQNVDELLKAVRSTLDGRQGNDQSAAAGLKRTFGFGSAGDRTADVSDDPATIYQNPGGIRPDAKRSPVIFIAAGAVAVFVVLVGVIAIGIWAMSGKADASNIAGQQKAANTNKTTTASGTTQRIRVDIDEGKAQVSRNGQVLGITPLDMDLANGENPSLTLHRDGFEDKTVQIEVGNGKKVFTFSLKPKN